MRPVVYSCVDASTKGVGWVRSGSEINYFSNAFSRNNSAGEGNGQYYTLSFTIGNTPPTLEHLSTTLSPPTHHHSHPLSPPPPPSHTLAPPFLLPLSPPLCPPFCPSQSSSISIPSYPLSTLPFVPHSTPLTRSQPSPFAPLPEFQHPKDTVLIAYSYPYSLTDYKSHIGDILKRPGSADVIRSSRLCTTLGKQALETFYQLTLPRHPLKTSSQDILSIQG